MSKDIWHTGKEIPDEDQYIVVKNNMGLYTVSSEFEYDLDRVEKWAYFDDFLTLETELDRTRKALDAAINAMKSAGTHNSINCIARGEDPSKDDVGITINRALNKITTLEQKDVK